MAVKEEKEDNENKRKNYNRKIKLDIERILYGRRKEGRLGGKIRNNKEKRNEKRTGRQEQNDKL